MSSLINYNNSDDIEMNGDLKNGDVSCVISLINSHAISQCNESSYFREMKGNGENCYVSGRHGSMKINTIYKQNVLS